MGEVEFMGWAWSRSGFWGGGPGRGIYGVWAFWRFVPLDFSGADWALNDSWLWGVRCFWGRSLWAGIFGSM
ncbi:hypothetical protein NYG88_04860 [Campylobacter felis]|uniref:hypothetical protein n=1 Tax=Campylobacter felis TaxID=2974565 RepID=UPI002560EBE6|nr:hypothetical protein [Campylobacter felis]